jgi:hypothetical protein
MIWRLLVDTRILLRESVNGEGGKGESLRYLDKIRYRTLRV